MRDLSYKSLGFIQIYQRDLYASFIKPFINILIFSGQLWDLKSPKVFLNHTLNCPGMIYLKVNPTPVPKVREGIVPDG